MSVYTQNHNIDGWPACKDGEPMGRKDCLAELQKLEAQIAALKEENESLKSQQPVARVWVSAGNQFADNFPDYSFTGIGRLPAGNHNLYLSPPAEAEEISALKARIAELERKTRIIMTIQEIADLAVGAGINMRESEFDSDPLDEIVVCQNVDLDNEDGTHTVWPLAFYWADYPEEGFTGIGDNPGAKPIKEPTNEGAGHA